jgi:DNA-binding response OmpR family regulator
MHRPRGFREPYPRERMTPSGGAPTTRIAVLDGDSGFLQVLARRVEDAGWQHRVLAAPVPDDELVELRLNAIVVDVALAGPDPWRYLESICERLPDLGVIVCTAQSSVAQRVRGLRSGADDWVSKPCHPEELVARLEAVIRSRKLAQSADEPTTTVTGEIEIRRRQLEVLVADESIGLTRREYELLELLASVEGRVIPREEIYQRVWGYAMAHGDPSVDVHIRKVRYKLECASPGWRYIHTHFGIGYRFGAEPLSPPPASGAVGAAGAPGAQAARSSRSNRAAAISLASTSTTE